MLVRRTKSEPVTYESDENAVENLSYNEDIFYGWDEVEDVPAPVQVKRPERHSRRPGDRLHKAVWSNDPAKVQKLVLYEGQFVDAWNGLGQTPLFVAAYLKKYETVSMLLNLGADPNVICVGGYTAVHAACYSASRRILSLILKFGGDLTIHDVHRSIPGDWIDWQPDEKRKIRILDLLESVRKTALKRSASSAATLRSQRSSSSSLPANEETGRALRLHHSRQHSHSLRNLSPNHHGSHPKVSKSHQISPPDHHYTFTRRLLSEQQRTKSNLEYYDQEKSLSSESESSGNEIVSNRKQKISLDCPDYAKTNTWYRHKNKSPSPPKSEPNRGSQKRYFINSTKGSQSFSQDLLNTNRKSPLYFTALESPEKRDAQIRSTISKVKNMYIGDQQQVDHSKKPSKSDAILKSKMPAPMAPNRFGCATLPTKLRQFPSLNQASKPLRQFSAPQMNPSVGLTEKLAAKRQSSAPQISVLPDEFRQVFQRITGAANNGGDQKFVNIKNTKESPVMMTTGIDKKANFAVTVGGKTIGINKKEAFKPASHFQQVRGYENAVPVQLCAEGENTSVYHSIPESSTLKDENEFAEMTENSALESSQDEATNIHARMPRKTRHGNKPVAAGTNYWPTANIKNRPKKAFAPNHFTWNRPTVPQPQGPLIHRRNMSKPHSMPNKLKLDSRVTYAEFDYGVNKTSSPMNNNAPVKFISNNNKNNPPPPNYNLKKASSWNAKKSVPVTLNTHQGEFEFHKTQHNNPPNNSNAKQAHFLSNGPVDVDEAIQDEKNNLFVTALAERSNANVDQNNGWVTAADNNNQWNHNAPPQASSEQNAWNQGPGWNNNGQVTAEQNAWPEQDQYATAAEENYAQETDEQNAWGQDQQYAQDNNVQETDDQNAWGQDQYVSAEEQNAWGQEQNAWPASSQDQEWNNQATDENYNQADEWNNQEAEFAANNDDNNAAAAWNENENYETAVAANPGWDQDVQPVNYDENNQLYETADYVIPIHDGANQWQDVPENQPDATQLHHNEQNALGQEENNAWGEDQNAGNGEAVATTEENIDENTFETAKMENDNREFVTALHIEDSNTNDNPTENAAAGDEHFSDEFSPPVLEEGEEDRDAITPRPPIWNTDTKAVATSSKPSSPKTKMDLNLNVDGAMNSSFTSSSGSTGSSSNSQPFVPPPFLRHKSSWLYNYAWSRRTSDASSFISGVQEIEDLYFDDEVNPNLENDPNMMLTEAHRNAACRNNNDINFPERPCLTDRDSVLSMDIPSTGPTSLRSELGDDMEPIVEGKE